ncbi:MAG: hypothetical protein Q9227_007036 [Pyrenula ochraceoflavens]
MGNQALTETGLSAAQKTNISKSSILRLPNEILMELAPFVNSMDDFINFADTCPRIHDCLLSRTPRENFLIFADIGLRSSTLEQHFLVAVYAREIGSWALASELDEDQLRRSFKRGVHGIWELFVKQILRDVYCELTPSRLQELKRLRDDVAGWAAPLIKVSTTQWREARERWGRRDHLPERDSGVQAWVEDEDEDEADGTDYKPTPNMPPSTTQVMTGRQNPKLTFWQLIIYHGLFYSSLLSSLLTRPQTRLDSILKSSTRIEFLLYCCSDWQCLDRSKYYPDTEPYFRTPPIGWAGYDNLLNMYLANYDSKLHLKKDALLARFDPKRDKSQQISPTCSDNLWDSVWDDVFMHLGLEGIDILISESLTEQQIERLLWLHEDYYRAQKDFDYMYHTPTEPPWPCLSRDLESMRYRRLPLL